jgi:hypothetical protein
VAVNDPMTLFLMLVFAVAMVLVSTVFEVEE